MISKTLEAIEADISDERAKTEDRIAHLYVIHHATEQRFKIGIANNLRSRLSSLGVINKIDRNMSFHIRCIAPENRHVEKALHLLLDKYRITNLPNANGSTEWFETSAYTILWRFIDLFSESNSYFIEQIPLYNDKVIASPKHDKSPPSRMNIRYLRSLAPLRKWINIFRENHDALTYSTSTIKQIHDYVLPTPITRITIHYRLIDENHIEYIESNDDSYFPVYEETVIKDNCIIMKRYRPATRIEGTIGGKIGSFSIEKISRKFPDYEQRLSNRAYRWIEREIETLRISKEKELDEESKILRAEEARRAYDNFRTFLEPEPVN